MRAAEDGRSITIEVADSGRASRPKTCRVSSRSYTAAKCRAAEGSGLGLALSQRIIMRHAGSLSVRTKREGPTGTVSPCACP